MHQMDPSGLITAEINSLNLYTRVQLLSVWPGDTVTDQLCLCNFKSQLCLESMK